MKKVRFAVGAIGIPAAIGLVIPAAQAETNGSHSPRNAGKSVSLGIRGDPLVTCGVSNVRSTAKGGLYGFIQFQGYCVHRQSAIFFKRQTGLTERIRYYSGGGYKEFSRFIGGHLGSASTAWWSSPNTTAAKVCEAIVLNSNHNDVKYGPVCENAG